MQLLTRTLGEICDEVSGTIRTGPFGSQLHESDYVREGIPVVMPKDIIQGKISSETIAHISEDNAKRLAQHRLRPGDIVYGRRGDIGRQALVTEREAGWLCGTGCLRLSLGNRIIDPTFLHYYLRDHSVIKWIANQAIGATLPNLNTSILRSVPVKYPDLHKQREIAGILLSYDKLIENNERRIRIQEELAQVLYREWFVHFRFPGHEKAKIVRFTLGEIPEGWKVNKLRDICERVDYGYTASANKDAIGPKFLRITDIVPDVIDWSSVPYCRIDASKLEKYRLRVGDIVIARTGATTGYAKRVQTDAPVIFASYLVRIRVRPEFNSHWAGVLVESSDYKNFIRANLGGAAQPQANAQVLTSIPIVIPPQSLLDTFGTLVQPLFDQKEILQTKNANLRRTRDLLLPKLISGEVSC